MLNDFRKDLLEKAMPPRKAMVKKGTLDIRIVESTPVVWKGRLMRYEWLHEVQYSNKTGAPCSRFTDWETEESTPPFALNYGFGSAHIEGDTAYVFTIMRPENGFTNAGGWVGSTKMAVHWSKDLINWETKEIIEVPGDIYMFNNSVCKGPDGYYMSIEIGGPSEIAGHNFTIIFAKSPDLLNWELMEMGSHIYTRERYSACPVIRYCDVDQKFYMIYLESLPCHRWQPYIVRTKDFVHYELGLKNPIFFSDEADKIICRPEKFTKEQIEHILNTPDCNNSDVDLCEFNGKTVILYSWGIQLGKEFLAYGEYDGPVNEFLMSFFAD